jgi:nucleoside phosphorylase
MIGSPKVSEGLRDTAIDVLLLAAHRLELEPFADTLGTERRGMLHGLCVAAAEVGVGMPLAGVGSLGCLQRDRPRCVVLVGSYGAYPGLEMFEPNRLLVPTIIRAVDGAVQLGHAAFPAIMPTEFTPDAGLSQGLAAAGTDVLRAPLATTLAITTDDALASRLGEGSGCVAENLEGLSVALACQARSVPFAAVLACTNRVGSCGRAQWAQHFRGAAEASARLVTAWLAAGAPGLPS